MPSNESADQTRVQLQGEAWRLRCHGWAQARIADRLGVDQSTVSRWLDAVERRELVRLSKRVEAQKVRQTGWLEHVLDEALQAWERSKRPKNKASKRTSPGKGPAVGPDGRPVGPDRPAETTVSEVAERDGEPAFLDRALLAARDLRRLWGVDAPAAAKDDAAGLTYSDLIGRLKANAARHDARPKSDSDGDG